jgi:hypothetical protein
MKERAQEAASPAPLQPKHSGEISKSHPSWTTRLIPTPTPEAREARELIQPNSIIRSTFEAKAKKISEAGQALAELEGYISGKVREWEKVGLTEALGLGTEINSVIKRYCENFNSNNKDSAGDNSTNSGNGNAKSWAYVAISSSNGEAPKAKAMGTTRAPPTSATRLFIWLPPEHVARTANPYATLQKLRTELPEGIGRGIRGIQAVPSGLAITTKDGVSPAYNLDIKRKIAVFFKEAEVEAEQKWAVYVIPDSPCSYRNYEGGQ